MLADFFTLTLAENLNVIAAMIPYLYFALACLSK